MSNLSNYINGEWEAGSGADLATIDPASGRQTWTSKESTPDDVARAVQDAHDAATVFDLLMGSDVAPRKEFIVAGSAGMDRDRIDA